ncbi:hypothetical protein BH11PSE13_BH11PSE13_05250 [soil metagenome]
MKKATFGWLFCVCALFNLKATLLVALQSRSKIHKNHKTLSAASMDRLRTIANQRELDPSFSVPCRQCAGLLQEWNRFCPFCLEDQFAPLDADAAAAMEPNRNAAVPIDSATADGLEFADTVHPAAAEVFPFPVSMSRIAKATTDTEISVAQTSDYWQTEVLGVGEKQHWAARLPASGVALGIALAALLGAGAFFGLGYDAFGTRGAFKDDTARVQTALNRGDLNSATQLLGALESRHPDDPAVQSLRDALDLRIQERSATRSESPDAPANIASNSSASDDTAPIAHSAPDQPPAGALAQADSPPRAPQNDCSVALAALALCPKE